MQTASDGGGGGSVLLNASALSRVAADLADAGTRMGSTGGDVQPGGDYGLAAGVVEGFLATTLDAAARFSVEATTIAGAVRSAAAATTADDVANAERLLGGGGRG